MKKAIVGLVTVGSVIALRPVGRRLGQKMREHCEQMAAQSGARGEAGQRMRECCEQMAAQSGASRRGGSRDAVVWRGLVSPGGRQWS
jgi:hypothetical protein